MAKPIKDEVEALREFKQRSGWSVVKIAQKLEVDPQTIRNWLKGRNSPAPLYRKAIKEFLIRAF